MVLNKIRCGALALTCSLCAIFADGAQIVTQPFLGITLYQRTEMSPRPLRINVVEIDLNAPGIRFLVTPRGSSPQPVFNGVADETVLQTPRQFANTTSAQIAINASYYAASAVHNVGGQSWTNDLGLTASAGDVYSKWEALPNNDNNYDDALNITASNQASIVKMPASVTTGMETSPAVSLYNTVTGKIRLLQNGVSRAPTTCSICDLNPRTAVGLTASNAKMLLMTVDGRSSASEGVTLVELANYLAEYGATNAINLDGGGSTQMAANFYGGSPTAELLNVPSESERAVGTNLAVFALPKGDFNQSGRIDAADYVTWRNSIGGAYAYDAWRANFGRTASSSASGASAGTAVPEPATFVIALFALGGLLSRTLHRPRR